MYVIMFVPRPFTVHNAFPCLYGRNKVILLLLYYINVSENEPPSVKAGYGHVAGTRLSQIPPDIILHPFHSTLLFTSLPHSQDPLGLLCTVEP